MEWISVKNKLPEIGKNVLLLTDSGVIEGCRDDGKWSFVTLYFHGCGCCSHDDDKVIHWMALPNTPK